MRRLSYTVLLAIKCSLSSASVQSEGRLKRTPMHLRRACTAYVKAVNAAAF